MVELYCRRFGVRGRVSWTARTRAFIAVRSRTSFSWFIQTAPSGSTIASSATIFVHSHRINHNVANYRLTGPCNKNLKTFPIDQQSCVLVYESFSHNYEEVKMEWISNGPPITLLNNIQLPDYTLVNFTSTTIKRVRQCGLGGGAHHSFFHRFQLYPPGVWNELVATFTFQRLYGFYILQVYVLFLCRSFE